MKKLLYLLTLIFSIWINLKSNILDLQLLKRLLSYVFNYKSTFIFVAVAAVLISLFSTVTPYLIKIAVDDYLSLGKFDDFMYIIFFMLINLLLTVIFMFLFSFYANLLGQNVIYDLRVKLFKHILDFKIINVIF